MQKYTQLTYEQRYHIYLLNKQGYNQTFIAKSINRSKSTISRELSRNTGKKNITTNKPTGLLVRDIKKRTKP
ncbi:Mobile element protein [uncultured Gammaproteobacteria bacterium]|nr:Mobile element protein [uncultured Gammaproteobacteria bacterium]CAC9531013.1 Mobile element protein [uncultured Gammaproteobacteria bacterium]